MRAHLVIGVWMVAATTAAGQGRVILGGGGSTIRSDLNSDDPEKRLAAAEHAGVLGRSYHGIPDRLAGVLKDPDVRVRRAAAKSLAEFGPSAHHATTQLAEALGDPDTEVCCLAADTLGQIGPQAVLAVPALIRAAQDQDPSLRGRAISALAMIGPAAKDAVPVLIKAIRDRAPPPSKNYGSISVGAMKALRSIGPAAAPAVPTLLDEVRSGDRDRASPAIIALGGIGPAQADIMPALLALLKNNKCGDPLMRPVLEGLWLIGPEAKKAVPTLLDHLRKAEALDATAKRELDDARFILLVLEKIGPSKESVAAIIPFAAKPETTEEMRRAAIRTLGVFGGGSPEGLATLAQLLTDPGPGVSAAAISALQQAGPPAVDPVIEVVRTGPPEARFLAIRLLGALGTRAAAAKIVPVLQQIADGPRSSLQKQAQSSIKEIKSAPKPRPLLGDPTN